MPQIKELDSILNILYAWRNLSEGNSLEALYYINKALETNPDNTIALFLKGIILLGMGDVEGSKETLEKLVKLSPKNYMALSLLSLVNSLLGDFKKSIELNEEALSIESQFLMGWLLKIINLDYLYDYDELLKIYKKFSKKCPKFSIIDIKSADILRKYGRYHEALEFLDKALSLNPENIGAIYLKGVILKRLGRYEEALECFKKLIDEMNIRWLDAIRHAASTCLVLDKLDDAERYVNMGLKIKNRDISLWYFKALIHEYRGNLDEALKCFQKVVNIYPNHVKAYLSMAKIYEKKGDYDKAIKYYETALLKRKEDLRGA
ncbi:hypothetical protein J422_02619 [Methanocaldococcus villosus KIN24-T80]|uniref:Uncharacterized protein n=1 Tax=Methanocaldococcus villosus KIN24-T80 TaxID=1069083 RepID=N6V226_9EURY|nr:tetratricopeptide repeat protein [Methanocaldococcus villosus]ENN96338.1 hypothetical protein J422_02619 [Methanocaldococcus villosus KIN24-T80]